MSHLTPETIARLVDEEPTAPELAHLEACAGCRDELEAMRDDVHALSLLPDLEPAPDAWPALEQRLEAEGLIRRRPLFSPARLSFAAAAVLLFLAGGVAGRVSAPLPQPLALEQPAPATPMQVAEPAPSYADVAPGHDGDVQAELKEPVPVRPAPRAAAGPRLAAAQYGRDGLPRTLDDAAALLRQSEELYLAALTRYAELATSADAGDPVSRLAALQSIVMTTQAALSQAPADPVINGYHLTALAQRDATLRQVATTSGAERW
jgi:hypothetical protein